LILGMLRDVLARQAQQMGLTPAAPEAAPPPAAPAPAPETPKRDSPPAAPPPPESPPLEPEAALPPSSPRPAGPGSEFEPEPEPLTKRELAELAEYDELAAQPMVAGHLLRTLRVLVVGLLAVLILVNLPLFNGLALARALPDRQALIIRDGLLLKGSGPEIYVLENDRKRWVSSLDAFAHYGYTWDEVHIVEDAFLQQFPDGRPLHVLLKCDASPHIYRLENDRKRWIKDIPTFEAEGHVWEDVRFVSCSYLRNLPDGLPIPPDAGAPPQP
jgi:hypothetical protein